MPLSRRAPRRWLLLGGAALALALLAWVLPMPWASEAGPRLAPPAVTAAGTHAAVPAAELAFPPTSSEAPSPAQRLAHARARLYRDGSFVGTTPTGDWCVSRTGLQPCEALRHRFEYYLLGVGDVDAATLRALVFDDATRAHGASAATEIQQLWDRYGQVRTHAYRTAVDPQNRATWRALLDEQHRVRREILGDTWAAAFFGAEEAEAQRDLAQLERGQPWPLDPGAAVPTAGAASRPETVQAERLARYGPAAAERLNQADAQWAGWTQRLATARAEWARLQAAPELSAPQRRQAITQHIQAHFAPGERRRVEALLDL